MIKTYLILAVIPYFVSFFLQSFVTHRSFSQHAFVFPVYVIFWSPIEILIFVFVRLPCLFYLAFSTCQFFTFSLFRWYSVVSIHYPFPQQMVLHFLLTFPYNNDSFSLYSSMVYISSFSLSTSSLLNFSSNSTIFSFVLPSIRMRNWTISSSWWFWSNFTCNTTSSFL